MKRIIERAVLVAAMGSGLAACGNSGGNASAPAPPPPPIVVQRQEDQFGANFATDFRAGSTANPATPANGDIIPLSLTTNPVNLD